MSKQFRPEADNTAVIARLAELQERISAAENRVRKLHDDIDAIPNQQLDADEAAMALSIVDPVWSSLTPREQARVVHLLVEQIDYDGANGKVSIAFLPTGIKTLASELAGKKEKSK